MIICSALYYTGSLARGDLIVRDNRFYPGKYVETFPVWWQYVRKHYPKEQILLFADAKSPIPILPLLETLPEMWWDIDQPHLPCSEDMVPRVWVKWLDKHSGKYFWPMQRNLVEGIIAAYGYKEDLFWLDNDAFLNTDIRPLIQGYDVAAPQIAHHQQTTDSVCTYISSERLHALDDLGIDLPSFLTTLLNEGPNDTRMHLLQEGGLYKLFTYGAMRSLGNWIELSHLSCYDNFMAFLKRNPLDTPKYRYLVEELEAIDWNRMPNVQRTFHDMDWRLS